MHSPVPLARITAMLNFDMVGRLRDSALVISGTGTAKAFPEIIERANADIRLHIIADANGDSPSDQMSFSSHRIPVLFFSTGLHADYHSVRDVASKINLSGETSVVALAERIIRLVGDRETILEFAVSRVRTLQVARPYLGVLLGGAPRSNGVEVAGIMPGSPAAKAGLVVGDIIERLNGVAIYDIGLYNQLLYSRSPRDTLLITLHRHGHQHIVPIQLGLAERD
jgi:hypothetical protein